MRERTQQSEQSRLTRFNGYFEQIKRCKQLLANKALFYQPTIQWSYMLHNFKILLPNVWLMPMYEDEMEEKKKASLFTHS